MFLHQGDSSSSTKAEATATAWPSNTAPATAPCPSQHHPSLYASTPQYTTIPNAYTLGLKMGGPKYKFHAKWVWDANRNRPVHENATLSFNRDGNLVLADVDGRVAWQTGTTNKGVVELKLLPNGNLVIYNAKNQFVWQSFDYPSDTLLVGQSLRLSGPTKIVSRMSDTDGSEGPYSLAMIDIPTITDQLNLYYKPNNSKVDPVLYYSSSQQFGVESTVTFNSIPETKEAYSYEIRYETLYPSTWVLARPNYNSTFSVLRLASNGNLEVHTYYDKIDHNAWEVTFRLFDKDADFFNECRLPSKCGSLGVCEDNQCVACPMPQGFLGWNKSCDAPKIKCNGGNAGYNYYKVVGVEHFNNWYTEGDGPVKVEECKAKCDKDCECLGYFYREDSSMCLLAHVLGTLIKVSDPTHVIYIKMSK
ncbi:hypothetical protein Syun_008834 [Stephania yunnanensis]|uniref:Bulb-type lectin domain-containing protein n=1 Tax=Stephania yunnanensis TaxID=152371 RepID=A0AAP0KG16_9MAGN